MVDMFWYIGERSVAAGMVLVDEELLMKITVSNTTTCIVTCTLC